MLIAHRGESFDAPENTMAAIDLAWQTGSRLVELDVRLTRDGRLVVCHDADTLRISGQKLVIADHALNELAHLDIGRWKGEPWAGQRLATLEQILAGMPKDGRLFIEIKDGVETVQPLIQAIRKVTQVAASQCVIISFHARVIAEVKRMIPELEACWLLSPHQLAGGNWWPDVKTLIDLVRAIGADGVDLQDAEIIDTNFVHALHEARLKVYVWTVDDPIRAGRLLEAGVDGVTTNRAAWMRKQNIKP